MTKREMSATSPLTSPCILWPSCSYQRPVALCQPGKDGFTRTFVHVPVLVVVSLFLGVASPVGCWLAQLPRNIAATSNRYFHVSWLAF